MAIIKVTIPLLFQILQEKLLLPNPILNCFAGGDPMDVNREVEILTEIEGFKAMEPAMPVYERNVAGKVQLLRIDHVE